jgi:uncharacterized protein with PIN domain
MATKRRHPKRRVVIRKTVKRMSRMVKRGGLKIGEKVPNKMCPECKTYTIVADGSKPVKGSAAMEMCKCTKCKKTFWTGDLM